MSLLKEKLHVYIERKTMFLISSSAIKIVKAVIQWLTNWTFDQTSHQNIERRWFMVSAMGVVTLDKKVYSAMSLCTQVRGVQVFVGFILIFCFSLSNTKSWLFVVLDALFLISSFLCVWLAIPQRQFTNKNYRSQCCVIFASFKPCQNSV